MLQVIQGGHARGAVLLCAPQNFACDTLCQRLLAAGVAADTMLRLMDPRLPPNRVVRLYHGRSL